MTISGAFMPKNKWGNINLALGLNIAIGMGICVISGYAYDQSRGEGYLGLIIGTLIGFLFCGYEFWKAVQQTENKQ